MINNVCDNCNNTINIVINNIVITVIVTNNKIIKLSPTRLQRANEVNFRRMFYSVVQYIKLSTASSASLLLG